jgi:hypothetical protein
VGKRGSIPEGEFHKWERELQWSDGEIALMAAAMEREWREGRKKGGGIKRLGRTVMRRRSSVLLAPYFGPRVSVRVAPSCPPWCGSVATSTPQGITITGPLLCTNEAMWRSTLGFRYGIICKNCFLKGPK